MLHPTELLEREIEELREGDRLRALRSEKESFAKKLESIQISEREEEARVGILQLRLAKKKELLGSCGTLGCGFGAICGKFLG